MLEALLWTLTLIIPGLWALVVSYTFTRAWPRTQKQSPPQHSGTHDFDVLDYHI